MHSSRSETLSVSATAAYIEELKGHRPNPATVFRWMQQGRLRSFYIGRRKFTTREAVLQLLVVLTAAADEVIVVGVVAAVLICCLLLFVLL